jgi:hypothetical protein
MVLQDVPEALRQRQPRLRNHAHHRPYRGAAWRGNAARHQLLIERAEQPRRPRGRTPRRRHRGRRHRERRHRGRRVGRRRDRRRQGRRRQRNDDGQRNLDQLLVHLLQPGRASPIRGAEQLSGSIPSMPHRVIDLSTSILVGNTELHLAARRCQQADCDKGERAARSSVRRMEAHRRGRRCQQADSPKSARGSTGFCIAR